MLRKSQILFIFVVLAAGNALADDRFPRPPELEPDVQFWIDIFTRYSTEEGVLHDNRVMNVVYGRIDMPSGLSRRERQRRITAERNEIRAVLEVLASGKREDLSAEESRILGLWPDDVSNETLRAAQKNPEQYRDLVVKVSGYSACFTDLGRSIQDDIIARTEYGEL